MNYSLDPILLTLIFSGFMAFLALVTSIIFLILRPRTRHSYSIESIEIYLGGESPSILGRRTPPSSNLYWGFVLKYAYKVYYYLISKVHTGRLSDWIYYMSSWYGFLIVISFLLIIFYIIMW